MIARKTFPAFHFALFAVFVLGLFGSPAYGQRRGGDQDGDEDNGKTIEHPNGLVQDWSHRHAVYPRVGPIQSLIKVQDNPRAIQHWQAAARSQWREWNNRRFHHAGQSAMHPDWNISLGGGTTAPAMYPAKFGFNVNAAPDCVNDFIVYPVNAVGGAAQPNIVGFNNLYSGTAPGPVGICNRLTPVNDDGVSATTLWSYDVHAAGGKVATSPALSLDGTKIAFVETKSTGAAHFHVLAWKSGDGLALNKQNVLLPLTINAFTTNAPVAGLTGVATDLPLGTTDDDTLSSPFIEYGLDMAYVGNDAGTLFRIQNVFCTFPQCTGAGSPAPTLDTTWPTSGLTAFTGTLSVCTGKLTGPVVDGSTGNVFVGCSDGKLYGFTSAGVALAGSPLIVGNGLTAGGIVDPPSVDGTNGFVYAVSGNSGGGTSVIVQAKTADLSSPVTAALGAGGSFNVHAPTFNDAYYSSGTAANWVLYGLALNAGGTASALYGVGFNGSRVMNSATVVNVLGIVQLELSPLTEFASGGQDRLFESDLNNNTGNTVSFRIDGVTTASFTPTLQSFVSEGCGTTGIVIDNVSASNQADSLYFGVLGGCASPGPNTNSAVKLTQGLFQ